MLSVVVHFFCDILYGLLCDAVQPDPCPCHWRVHSLLLVMVAARGGAVLDRQSQWESEETRIGKGGGYLCFLQHGFRRSAYFPFFERGSDDLNNNQYLIVPYNSQPGLASTFYSLDHLQLHISTYLTALASWNFTFTFYHHVLVRVAMMVML